VQDTLDLPGRRRPRVRPPRPVRPDPVPAGRLPVARVAVDSGLAHLDRPFDYLVPEAMSATAVPGSRVRVRLAGVLVGGLVLERVAGSDHPGRLTPLTAAVSGEPVLTPEIAGLARAVADRCAGALADVLRLAVPPRHGRVEVEPRREPPAAPAPAAPLPGGWSAYSGGADFLSAVAAGGAPRGAWVALPGPRWPVELAAAVAATVAGGRGAVVVVPDARDLARVDAALTAALGPGRHVALAAQLGPAERYRRWLRVLRGEVEAVVGTRAAVWAPVRDLGLVAVWDDGDDSLAEPRAPYPHARDVAVLRAHRASAGLLLGALAPSVEVVALLRGGWLRPLAPSRQTVRSVAPRVVAAGSDAELARDPAARAARLPRVAFEAVREGLADGLPVLVQVPRRGYQPGLACARCRTPARCASCAGPLGRPGAELLPSCRWCGRPQADHTCPACGGTGLRAVAVGERRTAEELGRALPGVTVRTSGGDAVLTRVPAGPSLVVATPGAEPLAPDEGYAAALLLDGWSLLGRPDVRAAEEAVRRWTAAASLVRPGGRVVLGADAGIPAVQALVRWDPSGFAAREADERAALRFPPAVRMAAVEGSPAAVAELLAAVQLPPGAELLGPVPVRRRLDAGRDGDQPPERALLRVAPRDGPALAAALAVATRSRSARKAEPVRVQLDPRDLG